MYLRSGVCEHIHKFSFRSFKHKCSRSPWHNFSASAAAAAAVNSTRMHIHKYIVPQLCLDTRRIRCRCRQDRCRLSSAPKREISKTRRIELNIVYIKHVCRKEHTVEFISSRSCLWSTRPMSNIEKNQTIYKMVFFSSDHLIGLTYQPLLVKWFLVI